MNKAQNGHRLTAPELYIGRFFNPFMPCRDKINYINHLGISACKLSLYSDLVTSLCLTKSF